MANTYEKNINEIMSELNAYKKSSIDSNVLDLNKSQINAQSIGSDEVVIYLNLNKKGGIVSSSGDENDGQSCADSNSDKPLAKSTPGGQSQSSADDSRNCDSTEDKSNKSTKGRTSRRTISESANEDSTKGILKYSYSWNRRTVSESHSDSIDLDLDVLSMFWQSVEDVYSDDELSYEKKHKKNVRFSENVSKTVFRPNSSILGRKMKNQKRAKNRKHNRKTESHSTENEENANKCESERIRQDSGYDSEDNVHLFSTEVSLKSDNKNIENSIETGIEKLSFN